MTMSPIDFRNATFASLRARVSRQRRQVYEAWLRHGPCTTSELSQRSGLHILSLRPRTTELVQLGFVCLARHQPRAGEGVYRARTDAEVMGWLRAKQRAAAAGGVQTELPLSAFTTKTR